MTATQTAVTADQIIAEVRRLAAERPDFVYKKPGSSTVCLYKHEDGTPGCIFGQALDNLGIPVSSDTYGSIGMVLNARGIPFTRAQDDWMAFVQGQQDTGHTWAESVAYADEYHPNV